jgi:hypothetical protein
MDFYDRLKEADDADRREDLVVCFVVFALMTAFWITAK